MGEDHVAFVLEGEMTLVLYERSGFAQMTEQHKDNINTSNVTFSLGVLFAARTAYQKRCEESSLKEMSKDGVNNWKYCGSVLNDKMKSTYQNNFEHVLFALADPTRRQLLDLIATRGQATASRLATTVTVSRQAVVKHLSVLNRASLVVSDRVGREVRYTVCPDQLSATAEWMMKLATDWDRRLEWIKHTAESNNRRSD